MTPKEDSVLIPTIMDIKVAENGRMILPLSVRRAMGLHGEAKVILTIEDDQVRLSPMGHGVSRAQALYRQNARGARSTNDFMNDRKAEASEETVQVDSAAQQRSGK